MKHPALVVYRKELLDTLRDRRTLAAMILVPMVVYPATLLVTTETVAAEQQAAVDEVLDVGAAPALPPDLATFLSASSRVRVTTVAETPIAPAEARRLLKDGLHAVVVLTATDADAMLADGTGRLTLYHDPTRPSGPTPRRRLQDLLRSWSRRRVADRIEARGLPATLTAPLEIRARTVATEGERGNHLLGLALPSLVLLFVALSSLYPAIDLTAGEKERRTIATLLTTPTPVGAIVTGKLLAVVTVGTLAGLLNVAALGLTFLRVMSEAAAAAPVAFSLGPGTILGLLGGVLAAAFPLGAVMLLFASFARSFRDANLLLTPVLLVTMVPAAVVLLPGAELDGGFALVPVANAALWMKATLTGGAPWDRVVLVLLSSGGLTAALGAGVVRAFSDERALFSSEGPRADLRRLFFEPPKTGPGTAVAFAGAAFCVTFFAGLLTRGSALVTLAVTQLLGYGAPALGLARWMRGTVGARALLGLRRPSPAGVAAGVGLGLFGWLGVSLPAGWLTDWVLPGQAEAAARFARALDLDATPFPLLVLLAAVLPGLLEELAFRGAIFRLLGAGRGALWAQAALFGLMHGSVYRVLPTGALGLCLGYLRWKTGSVWPGVIAHTITNATLLGLQQLAPAAWRAPLQSPTAWALAGAAGVALALGLARRASTDAAENGPRPPVDSG